MIISKIIWVEYSNNCVVLLQKHGGYQKLCKFSPPIKFNLKLEASYSRPSVPNSLEYRAFKTSAVNIFVESNTSVTIQ